MFLSAYHDYRTKKRASIHQVARAMAQLGYQVSFISMRFSWLSRWKGDSRLFLWDRANRSETVDGIECYLWRTTFHPFASSNRLVMLGMGVLFPLFGRLPSREFDAIISRADDVIIESSVAAIFVRRVRRLTQSARIIYYATDQLDTIGAHPFVRSRLELDAPLIHHVCARSRIMVSDFPWAASRIFRAEFAIDPSDFSQVGPNPYGERLVAVSVGSMLFDPFFFTATASSFPDIEFHVIGCGVSFDPPSNVIIHDEMRFQDTLPYLKYASVGLAPYRNAPGVEYLAETSLKLAQFEFLGMPAVCPNFATGRNPARFGYSPDDESSMRSALARALGAVGTIPARHFKTWKEVALEVLEPLSHGAERIG